MRPQPGFRGRALSRLVAAGTAIVAAAALRCDNGGDTEAFAVSDYVQEECQSDLPSSTGR